MARIKAPEMAFEQCITNTIMDLVSKQIQKARKAYLKAQEEENQVYRVIDAMCIDLDAPSNAENADNLKDAISCYLCYGEYGLNNLLNEIRGLYEKQEDSQ